MILNWSKSPQVSMTLLSILYDLNKAVVWMMSACPHISKFSSPFTKPLGIVLSAPIIIWITVTFMYHSFFSSLAKFKYLSLFVFFQFYILVCRNGKVYNLAGSPSLVDWLRLGDRFVSQNPREFCASHSPDGF